MNGEKLLKWMQTEGKVLQSSVIKERKIQRKQVVKKDDEHLINNATRFRKNFVPVCRFICLSKAGI
jgi:hypothetical protein